MGTMTEVSIEVGTHYPGMFVVAGGWILINMFTLGIWFLSTLFTVYELKNVQNASDALMYGVMCYFVLTLYWIAYVNMYIVHCVSAGVFGQWYFTVSEQDPAGLTVAATAPALGRAMTSSFGSICLGALIIATIELLNAMARQAQRDADSMAAQFVACCIRCLLECIGDIVRFINRYAFTICSIYGDSYCEGVKITMDILQQNGFEAIINDDLVGTFLGMGALVGGLLAGGIGVLVAHAEDANTDQLVVVFVAGLLMGLSKRYLAMHTWRRNVERTNPETATPRWPQVSHTELSHHHPLLVVASKTMASNLHNTPTRRTPGDSHNRYPPFVVRPL